MQLKLQQTGDGAGDSPAPQKWAHSAKGAHPYRKACRSRGIKVAAPPLDTLRQGTATYSSNPQEEEEEEEEKRRRGRRRHLLGITKLDKENNQTIREKPGYRT